MLRRGREERAPKGAGEDARKQQEKEQRQEEEDVDVEEEYPDNVECEEYDEEDVYVMVELPAAVDGETLLSASSVAVKVCLCACVRVLFCLA